MTDTKAPATQHTHINFAPSKTHIHICIYIQKNTPATQHKLQKPKFTQFKPQQKKSEKAQYQSYKHNTAVATQQKPTCEKVKQILKLSTQLSTCSQQVPIQYSIIISKLNPITLYI